MASRRPYYHRSKRSPSLKSHDFRPSYGDHVDFSNVALGLLDYGGSDLVAKAQSRFDDRAAACVSAATALDGRSPNDGPVRIWPAVEWIDDDDHDDGPVKDTPLFWARDLLELKWYDDAPTVYLLTGKCLAAMAYLDFFPDDRRVGQGLRTMVSAAVLAAGPGWCGTWGPDMESMWDVLGANPEGNYDMTQMRLVHMAYQYHDVLSPQAAERLLTELLAHGRIDRINRPDTLTSGYAPDDWDRAGYINPGEIGVAHTNIGETENHILMIATVRYLTNQLLFQRDHALEHDNRRNGSTDSDDGYGASCASILLTLLRNYLRDDFSEYNAKGYQEETRWALLNLCTYAYDHEVRLAARMVLDYVAAHVVVSSNDLRRLVPFRRRNEPGNVSQIGSNSMSVAMIDGWPNGSASPPNDDSDETDRDKWEIKRGADPLGKYFAVQAGNLRVFAHAPAPDLTWAEWGIPIGGNELAMEVLSDYRLPPSIHDLFVTDLHRRFYQRLHRTVRQGEMGGNHNADNMEIYAGSPSYLITAGGSPSDWAIDPGYVVFGEQGQQLGVAVTTSFMPTTQPGDVIRNDASQLIQFSQFAQGGESDPPRNYGVAPDFACGHNLYLPAADDQLRGEGFKAMDRSRSAGRERGAGPGYYLAVHRFGNLALLEAFDTWLRPEVDFGTFVADVRRVNAGLQLRENEEFVYTTHNGTRVRAVIWSNDDSDRDSRFGAEVLKVEYGAASTGEHGHAFAWDAIGDAGNVTNRFLNGTVLNSPAEAMIEVTNPALGKKLTLDMRDPWHPKRTLESGAVEEAGNNHEVWLDFDWRGPSAGDVCQPFKTLAAAVDAVAAGGIVKATPGTTLERSTISVAKPFTLVAPIGGVVIGARDPARRIPESGSGERGENVTKDDVWVQFDLPASNRGNAPGRLPFATLKEAAGVVADGGLIRIVPGRTRDRSPIGRGKRFTVSAPIGQVTIGGR